MRGHRGFVLLILVGSLVFAASAQAGTAGLVNPQPVGTIKIDVPLASTIDPITEDRVYVIEDSPPAEVFVYHLSSDGTTTPEDPLPLPQDVTPSVLWWDSNGLLHIETREKRSFTYCPDCDTVEEIKPRAAGIGFIGGVAQGYVTQTLTDYGSGSSGSIWWGSEFANQLVLADGEHPGAIDYGGYGGVQKGMILGGFATYDGLRDRILVLGDAEPPSEVGAIDGPPGVGQLSGLAISPLNLSPSASGPGTLPLFVATPGNSGINSGNIYYSENWAKSPTPTWQPISSTPTGIPTGLDAGCRFVLANDYANDAVNIYGVSSPESAECERGIRLPPIDPQKFAARVSRFSVITRALAYINAEGKAAVGFNVSAPAPKRQISASAKVSFQAGHLSTVKVRFSKSASAALGAALDDRGKLKGTATVKVADKGGHRITVTQPVTLKAG